MLKQLVLNNFRSYRHAELAFDSPWTVFSGANGAGKSNLVEAVFFLAMLRSFRTTAARELIMHGENAFSLEGRLERGIWQEELSIAFGAGNERSLERNGKIIRKSSSFINLILPVAFAPEDIMLISGSASHRRRFVDMYLSMLDDDYRNRLYHYNSALLQRNNALKRGGAAAKLATAFEPLMAENAVYIIQRRRLFTALLAEEATSLLAGSRGDQEFSILYRPDFDADSPADYRTMLAEERPKALKRGCTLSGPQLDDFNFMLNSRPMRSYASTGQRRKLAIYLKLAAYAVLRRQSAAGKAALIVLVDDVTGELDAENRELFFEKIRTADQAFFTFTAPPVETAFAGAGLFEIADSSIRRQA